MTLGRFRLTAQIGKGGMGEVWKAQDPRLGRDVAIKVLPPEFESDPQLRVRFERESKVLAALNHPNIAQIYEAGDEIPQLGNVPQGNAKISFLVMELVDGKSLADILLSDKLPLPAIFRFGRQISRALSAAHKASIVHRDLKPANIMVSSDGVVKVLDFGLAKPVAKSAQQSTTFPDVTSAGVVMGTAAYMAPEQVKGETVDQESDIWAIGCCLYQMVTGWRPFEGESIPEIMASILRDEPEPPSVRRRDCPAGLSQIVMQCLSKDRAQRPRDVSSIGSALKMIQDEYRLGAGARAQSRRSGGSAAGKLEVHVQTINRFLKTMNAAYPQLSEDSPTFIEVEHQGTKMMLMLSSIPKRSCEVIAFVAPVLELPMRAPSDFLKKMLTLSAFDTDVAHFSIDPDLEWANLVCVRPCANLDYKAFEQTMDSMSRLARKLGASLKNEFPVL